MMKRLCLALAGLFALAQAAHASGTVPGFSLTPQFDQFGKVMPGCKLYVYQAGTVATPQEAYQDTGLTNLQSNPILCDASGRLPQWFVADGLIKLRLSTATGTDVFAGDNLLVVGPSSGGGGGGTVDPTTVLQTGDIKVTYGVGSIAGFVRANGRTIGSVTSGATERANADTQALFQYLWTTDANLAVSGGRGASAAADWSANKTIALPDWRGRALAGLDDMGNSPAGVLTSAYYGANPTVLGSSGGSQTHTLVAYEAPVLPTSGITATSSSVATGSGLYAGNGSSNYTLGGFTGPSGANAITITTSTTIGGTINATGGNPHPIVGPRKLATIYLKL